MPLYLGIFVKNQAMAENTVYDYVMKNLEILASKFSND